jgi:hypothetical protein
MFTFEDIQRHEEQREEIETYIDRVAREIAAEQKIDLLRGPYGYHLHEWQLRDDGISAEYRHYYGGCGDWDTEHVTIPLDRLEANRG